MLRWIYERNKIRMQKQLDIDGLDIADAVLWEKAIQRSVNNTLFNVLVWVLLGIFILWMRMIQ